MTSGPSPGEIRARAPGRVNLIGDHTDYNQGLALPMAIDLATEVGFRPDGTDVVTLTSTLADDPVRIPLDLPADRQAIADAVPPWARMAAAVVTVVRPHAGGTAHVSSDVPTGAGLSSSASFCVGLALALGWRAEPTTTATMGQRAESLAGADVGLMDPLVISAARAGHALCVDFAGPRWDTVPVPESAAVVIVDSGERRTLADSHYRARRAECEAAAIELRCPLGRAEAADLPGIIDPVLRRRTRHVITECARVRTMARVLAAGDLETAGALMDESHQSLAGDFEVSTPTLDALVAELRSLPGVLGARLTGGGFGGCVVALARPGSVEPGRWPGRSWVVRPAGPAALVDAPAD